MVSVEILVSTYLALLGTCFASFGCVLGERRVQSRNLSGRSTCVCGRQLTWYENIPVFGYLACRGTARCCGATIPRVYVLCEIFSAAVSGLAGSGVLVIMAIGYPQWALVGVLSLMVVIVAASAAFSARASRRPTG